MNIDSFSWPYRSSHKSLFCILLLTFHTVSEDLFISVQRAFRIGLWIYLFPQEIKNRILTSRFALKHHSVSGRLWLNPCSRDLEPKACVGLATQSPLSQEHSLLSPLKKPVWFLPLCSFFSPPLHQSLLTSSGLLAPKSSFRLYSQDLTLLHVSASLIFLRVSQVWRLGRGKEQRSPRSWSEAGEALG